MVIIDTKSTQGIRNSTVEHHEPHARGSDHYMLGLSLPVTNIPVVLKLMTGITVRSIKVQK